MSRVNLGLHQSDVSVAWDLGPHDFSILRYWLEATPSHVARDEPQLHLPDHPRRRVHQPRVRAGCHRARRALVARAEQAAPNDDRRLTEDGRLRRRQQRAGAHLRLGRDGPESAVVRRVPALLPHRRDRLARDASARASPGRDGGLLPFDPHRRDAALVCSSSGVEVVRMIEAVDASLGAHGARVELLPAVGAAAA